MNISTRGVEATYLLGSILPNGQYIYIDHTDHKMYSTNPLEVQFKASLEYATEVFKRIVHDISVASNLLPGQFKRLGLFKINGNRTSAINAVELNTENTACSRTNQSFLKETLLDCTKDPIPKVVECVPFKSNGYLEED